MWTGPSQFPANTGLLTCHYTAISTHSLTEPSPSSSFLPPNSTPLHSTPLPFLTHSHSLSHAHTHTTRIFIYITVYTLHTTLPLSPRTHNRSRSRYILSLSIYCTSLSRHCTRGAAVVMEMKSVIRIGHSPGLSAMILLKIQHERNELLKIREPRRATNRKKQWQTDITESHQRERERERERWGE